MSILINMEMPSSCLMCPMAHRNYRLEAEETQLACYAKCKWVSDDGERPDWCPLIEIPPHGRLIDADAYKDEMKKRQDATAEWLDNINNGGGYGTQLYYRVDSVLAAFCEAELMLDKIPTILPASEVE